MSEQFEKLAQKLEHSVGRRGFLGKLAAASAALAASIFGFAQKSEALVVACVCCTLCLSPSGCTGCACTWSWFCCPGADQRARTCGECYRAGFVCNGSCSGVFCSFCRTTQLIC